MYPPPDYQHVKVMHDQRLQDATRRRTARRLRHEADREATRRAAETTHRAPSLLDEFGSRLRELLSRPRRARAQ